MMKLENLDKDQQELFVTLMNNLTGEDFKRVSELMANEAIKYHQDQLNKLSLDSVSFSLPTTEQMEDQSYVIGKEYKGDYPDVLEEGFEMCYDWIKKSNES